MGGVSAVAGDRITDVAGIAVGHHSRLDDVVTGDAGIARHRMGHRDDGPHRSRSAVTAVVCAAVGLGRGKPTVDPGQHRPDHARHRSGWRSAFGLAAADGVMPCLEERGVGPPMDALDTSCRSCRGGHLRPACRRLAGAPRTPVSGRRPWRRGSRLRHRHGRSGTGARRGAQRRYRHGQPHPADGAAAGITVGR